MYIVFAERFKVHWRASTHVTAEEKRDSLFSPYNGKIGWSYSSIYCGGIWDFILVFTISG
jgi:hypothetical protein